MTDAEQKAFDEQKAKIEELTRKESEATAEAEKQKGIADNAEVKFKEMGAETGENRKAVADAGKLMIETKAAREKAEEDLRQAHEELAELKKQGPTSKGEESGDEKKTADEIEVDLTKDEAKVVDVAYEGADDETKARIKADPKFRKKFFITAKASAETTATSDLTTWRNKPAHKKAPSSSDDDAIKKLFIQTKDRADFVPNGPRGGTPRPGTPRPQGGDDSKPRPKNRF